MVVGALALAGVVAGCVSGNAGEDKVAAWQKDRAPVELLKSNISVKAAGVITEALDVAPYGIYKSVADKVDKAAVMDRYRKIYLGYVADIQEMEKQGKSRQEAIKIEMDQIRASEGGAETIAKLQEYLRISKESNFEAIKAWCVKMGEDISAMLEKFSNEAPNAHSQIVEIAQKEGGMAALTIPKQGKDDLAYIGDQLADAGKGLALYKEMMDADEKAAQMQADYPVEG